ncbi:tapetal oleosin GRP-16-like [Cryptomeria japonica]|uniref:tapetal oleosin GRP-16-like n=1 Tax=Cryptomeria japonica TaxID=3369 RepID=UPI0025AC5A29|nr:tapetal oleosin GRP-16-like [Cryptomeria japonica]
MGHFSNGVIPTFNYTILLRGVCSGGSPGGATLAYRAELLGGAAVVLSSGAGPLGRWWAVGGGQGAASACDKGGWGGKSDGGHRRWPWGWRGPGGGSRGAGGRRQSRAAGAGSHKRSRVAGGAAGWPPGTEG